MRITTDNTQLVALNVNVHHNIIYNNTSKRSSAGALVFNVVAKGFNNNTIVNNKTEEESGGGLGVYLNMGTSAELYGANNIVFNNTAGTVPSDIDVDGGGVCFLSYSCSSTDISGPGNIKSDPLFVNPGKNDFHLSKNSPCIDSGDPNSPKDPDSTRVDMGALYCHQGVNILSNSTTAYKRLTIWKLKENLFFITAPAKGNYTFKLYTLNGQLLRSKRTNLSFGDNILPWNISNHAQVQTVIQVMSGTGQAGITIPLLR